MLLPPGLCPSSACCWEPPFPGEPLGHLTHSRLDSVPISPSQCGSQPPTHSWSFLPSPTPPFLLQHLSPSNVWLSLLIYYAIDDFCPPTTTTAPHHHHPLPNSVCGRSGIFDISFTGISQALRTVSGTWWGPINTWKNDKRSCLWTIIIIIINIISIAIIIIIIISSLKMRKLLLDTLFDLLSTKLMAKCQICPSKVSALCLVTSKNSLGRWISYGYISKQWTRSTSSASEFIIFNR